MRVADGSGSVQTVHASEHCYDLSLRHFAVRRECVGRCTDHDSTVIAELHIIVSPMPRRHVTEVGVNILEPFIDDDEIGVLVVRGKTDSAAVSIVSGTEIRLLSLAVDFIDVDSGHGFLLRNGVRNRILDVRCLAACSSIQLIDGASVVVLVLQPLHVSAAGRIVELLHVES